LPEYTDATSVESVISDVFYKEDDGRWIAQLPMDKCVRLVNALGLQGLYEKDSQDKVIQEIMYAIKVLSHRMAGYAMDAGITILTLSMLDLRVRSLPFKMN
jgi:site-specific recombinase